MSAELNKKTILTNIPHYYVTDETCENLFFKARMYGFEKVLIGPSTAKIAQKLRGDLKVGISISYPAGAVYPELKADEIKDFEENGLTAADEYYVTAALGYFISGHPENLEQEMSLCVAAANGKPVYFFLEAAEMSDADIESACAIAKKAGVKGLVASNGFLAYDIKRSGPEDIKRLKKYADGLEILACGLLKSEADIEASLEAGADCAILDDPNVLI